VQAAGVRETQCRKIYMKTVMKESPQKSKRKEKETAVKKEREPRWWICSSEVCRNPFQKRAERDLRGGRENE